MKTNFIRPEFKKAPELTSEQLDRVDKFALILEIGLIKTFGEKVIKLVMESSDEKLKKRVMGLAMEFMNSKPPSITDHL